MFQLSCGVRAYWESYREYRGDEVYSNSYYVGILVEPDRLVVSESDDQPRQIRLTSTLPVLCKTPRHQGRCEIVIRVVTPERLVTSQGGTRHTYAQCAYRISREDWKTEESLAYNASAPLDVRVKRDPYVRDGSSQFINFERIPYGIPDIVQGENGSVRVYNQIWDGYSLPHVRVGYN